MTTKPEVNYFFEDVVIKRHLLPAKRWIKTCLLHEGYTVDILNFIYCSDHYLQKINNKYLNKDYLTDVISFEHHKPKFMEESHAPKLVSGDIFISIDRVRENKQTYNTIFIKELKRVMIHGALHLIGFNDSTKKDRGVMLEKENIYIDLK